MTTTVSQEAVEVTQEDLGWATSAAQHLCSPQDRDAAIRLLAQAFARHRQQAERGEVWRPIETAPYDTPVEVKVGSMTFLARLLADASMSSLDETCDQWQAEIDGEHPPCWSGGACWASNENEDMSLQPTAWRLTTPPEAV